MFQKGKSGNPRGKSNPGLAGRKSSVFVSRCKNIFDKEKLLKFFADVAAGKSFPQWKEGELRDIPAEMKDRLFAAKEIKEWAYGKSIQPIGDKDDGLQDMVVALRTRYAD